MKIRHLFIALIAFSSQIASAESFESATDAVKNMGIGWNLGNTLDSNSGDVTNMWISAWGKTGTTVDYETAWGQPVTQRALIKMFADAGFKAIRVPVTWLEHIGNMTELSKKGYGKVDFTQWTGYDINADWMARVKEVVDMVIGEGMYCILNVHHDTGSATTAWLRADETVYEEQKERFEALWTAIATEFKDYDEKLLFEGYNEMLDTYSSWCYASFATSKNYDSKVAASAYSAINKYAQSFVNAVRATGGNNAERNLIVNTYGSCNGEGTWNKHLTDPLKEMALPNDPAGKGHIAFEIHGYPYLKSESEATSKATELIKLANDYLVTKGAPVIYGEWGTSSNPSDSDTETPTAVKLRFARTFVEKIKEAGMACFYWMGLSDGTDRSVPKWTDEALKDAIVKGYYGDKGYTGIANVTTNGESENENWYTLQGVRIDRPTAPGIYIHNHKKVLKR